MSDPAVELNARVVHRLDLTARLSVVRVAPEGWSLPPFSAGQWATLGLPETQSAAGAAPKLLKRVYSIASAPGRPELEFFIQLVKEGEFTTKLWPLENGDRLWLSPKIGGHFTLAPVPKTSRIVLIGTGTGVAPFVSMVRAGTSGGPGHRPWKHCVLVHGARDQSELGFRAELHALAASDTTFTYLPMLTREPLGSTWSGRRGRVQSLLDGGAFARFTGQDFDPADTHVLLCGNPEMIDDMERRLGALGFLHHTREQAGNLHFERYW